MKLVLCYGNYYKVKRTTAKNNMALKHLLCVKCYVLCEMPYDPEKHEDLRAARQADRTKPPSAADTAQDIKTAIQSRTPLGMAKTLGKMNPIADWPYGVAIIAAVFRDFIALILTFFIITWIIVVITTLCVSIFIAMMMLTARNGKSICWITLFVSTAFAMFVPFPFIMTGTVFTIYSIAQSTRKPAEAS